MKALWELFNKKKTAIGAGLLLAALILGKMSATWDIEAGWIAPMIETLEWFGGMFAGVGLGHKSVKAVKGE